MSRWAKIRFAVAGVVVGALLAGIWLVPGVASAENAAGAPGVVAGATYSDSDCEALLGLGDDIPDAKSKSNDIYGDRAEAVSEGFSETAQEIDNKKLRNTMNTLADYYGKLGDANSVAGAIAVTVKAGKKYVKALATWSKATLSCAVSNVTIPSITLPAGVTLPSGITLPNITLPTVPR
jgi:hypothetical protein